MSALRESPTGLPAPIIFEEYMQWCLVIKRSVTFNKNGKSKQADNLLLVRYCF
jgi:hypothetical protein